MSDVDWTPELADDDLDTLMEALEAREVKDLSGEIMVDLVDSMLSGRGPKPPQVIEARERERHDKEAAKKLRKERSVLLRAKLLTIRDRRRAERMTTEALR